MPKFTMKKKKNSRENLKSPSRYSSEEARSKVPGGVDGVASIESHGQADDGHHQANGESFPPRQDWIIVRVYDGEDTDNQCCGSDNLNHKQFRIVKVQFEIRVSRLCVSEVRV